MKNLYYHVKENMLAHIADEYVKLYEHRHEYFSDTYIAFWDLADGNMYLYDEQTFDDDFISVDVDNINEMRENYDFLDDIQFAKFKKLLIEIIEYEE